jgi:hypothetical protein
LGRLDENWQGEFVMAGSGQVRLVNEFTATSSTLDRIMLSIA